LGVETVLDRAKVREWFPSLASGFAYLENAGGSQVPGTVATAMADYLTSSYVQLGAGYPQSKRATETVAEAHQFMETFMNATGAGNVILGPSTTALCHILARAVGDNISPGDEIIVAESSHEANAGPWANLERRGAVVRIWKLDPDSFECPLSGLESLLNHRTKIVALPHVSNILGQVTDLAAVGRLAHAAGARVVADGVAYAPHRLIDVEAWQIDFYVFSNYKVYGPHMATMFGSYEAFAELTGPNHFFIPRSDTVHKFELGGISHEACAGLLALRPYLRFLAGRAADDRQTVIQALQAIEELDAPLESKLISYLKTKPSVKLIGSQGQSVVGTVSFVHSEKSSPEIVAEVDRHNIGIRYGNMYAYRLMEALGIDPATGVVRVSAVHYNMPEEIDRLIDVFERVL
jgi:cysteine desulfurase family protein (TIGR01976 family)